MNNLNNDHLKSKSALLVFQNTLLMVANVAEDRDSLGFFLGETPKVVSLFPCRAWKLPTEDG